MAQHSLIDSAAVAGAQQESSGQLVAPQGQSINMLDKPKPIHFMKNDFFKPKMLTPLSYPSRVPTATQGGPVEAQANGNWRV